MRIDLDFVEPPSWLVRFLAGRPAQELRCALWGELFREKAGRFPSRLEQRRVGGLDVPPVSGKLAAKGLGGKTRVPNPRLQTPWKEYQGPNLDDDDPWASNGGYMNPIIVFMMVTYPFETLSLFDADSATCPVPAFPGFRDPRFG